MFINFINTNNAELEAEVSALTAELSATTAELDTITEEYTSVIDRSVEEVEIPYSTEVVGKNIFNGCSGLTSVVIPETVQSIEVSAFAGNENLERIVFEGEIPPTVAEGAFSDLPRDVEVVVPSGATDAYSAVTENIEDSRICVVYLYSGETLTTISLSGKTLTNANLPTTGTYTKLQTVGVEIIDDNCFVNLDCEEYDFDESMAWSKCTPFWRNAKKITFRATALSEYFDARLFSSAVGGCATSSLTFCCQECPTRYINLAESGQVASTGTLYVPEGSTGWHELINYELTSAWTVYDVANSSHTMGMVILNNDTSGPYYYGIPSNYRKGNTSVTKLITNDGVVSIGDYAFQNCTNLSSITLSDGIRQFGKMVFSHCGITEITIPSGLSTIPNQVFANCTSLTNVVIPSGITSLQKAVFQNCTSLSSITCYAQTAPSLGDNYVFNNVASTGTLFIPSGSNYSTWSAKLPAGWTIEEIFLIHQAESVNEIIDAGCFIYQSGATQNDINTMFDDGQNLWVTDWGLESVYNNTPIGQFHYKVEYDANSASHVALIDLETSQPLSAEAQAAIADYVAITGTMSNGNFYATFNFNQNHTLDNSLGWETNPLVGGDGSLTNIFVPD